MPEFRKVEWTVAVVSGAGALVGVVTEEWRLAALGVMGLLVTALLSLRRAMRLIDGEVDNNEPGHASESSGIASTDVPLSDVSRLEPRLDEILRRIDRQSRELVELREEKELLRRQLASSTRWQTNEIGSLFQLHSQVSSRQPMPGLGQWSVGVQELLLLFSVMDQSRPETIVELGSGSSTIWMGHGVTRYSKSRIVSVEHLPEVYERTLYDIQEHGIDSVAAVRLADMVPIDLDHTTFFWYDVRELDDIDKIDFLFVDGPPGGVRPMAKLPALPMLGERLTPKAIVVLREIDASARAEIARRWCEEFVGLERLPSACEDLIVLRNSA